MKKYLFIALLFITACSTEKTIMPTVALQPPATATASPLPSPTQEIASPIPKPTEYPDALKEQKVEEYLLTNNGCILPCFWGVIPGDTSLNNAIDFFQPFGINSKYAVNLYIFSRRILNGAVLFEEEGKVVGLEVFGEGRPDEISFFWDVWIKFLPQGIIDQYGFPDRVWFDTYHNPEVPNPDRPIGYSLWFFYDAKDFLLVYSGITTKAPEYQVCLGSNSAAADFGNLSPYIRLLIHKNLPLEDLALERGIEQRVNFSSDKNVEIPLDEFRRLLDNQDGCFNTPIEFQPE